MSGVPMRADVGHAFSGGLTSSEGRGTPPGQCPPADAPTSAGAAPPGPEITYEASPAYGNTGEWRVLELPGCVEVARFPTPEAAASHALALLEWLAARPDPAHCAPFFVPALPDDGWRASGDRLFRILDDMLRPETP